MDRGRRIAVTLGLVTVGAIGGGWLGTTVTDPAPPPAAGIVSQASFSELSANPDALTGDNLTPLDCADCGDRREAWIRLRAARASRADAAKIASAAAGDAGGVAVTASNSGGASPVDGARTAPAASQPAPTPAAPRIVGE